MTAGSMPAWTIRRRTSTSAPRPVASFNIVDSSRPGYNVLETIDAEMAFFQVHPGAVYLHQGETYTVTQLDLYTRNAFVVPGEVNYYTQARDITDVRIIQSQRSRPAGTTDAFWGNVRVTTQVIGFRRKQQFTDQVLSDEPLDLPAQSYETMALWFTVPHDFAEAARNRDKETDVAGSLHAIEHAAIGLLPLYAMCDRNDIGGLSMMIHPDTGGMTIFIYDGPPGGVGISEKGFEMLPQLWRATLQLLRSAPAKTAVPRACRAQSAATTTTRSTKPELPSCSAYCLANDRHP